MARGWLRVYLGPAPGAGKTFRMLEEGRRRQQRGADVVVAVAEAHERPLTAAQLQGLEVVAPTKVEVDGALVEEMDLDAVLKRMPAVALVDELAHANVVGSRHARRWEDVESLLDHGIDVITTIDVQHLESLNDVVERLTGQTVLDTVPDVVVRRAEQIELVDITPEALRRRVAHGNVFPPDRVDASLATYFREDTLTKLRELALLWLAEHVEDSLARYRQAGGSHGALDARERIVVGVEGSAADAVLLRRAARLASRTGAELAAVHVARPSERPPARDTSVAREAAARLGGTFHELVDDDVASALLAFAGAERGTQVVLGRHDRPRAGHRLRGVVGDVLREPRGIDVHLVPVGALSVPVRRRRATPYTLRRRLVAIAGAIVVLPLLTLLLTSTAGGASTTVVFSCYLFAVVGLSVLGGTAVGVATAVVAAFLENYFFVAPTHTLEVARAEDVVALVVFLVFSVGASVLTSEFARRSHEAERARAEAAALARAAGVTATASDDLEPVLESLCTIFTASGAAMVQRDHEEWSVVVAVGEPIDASEPSTRFEVDATHELVLQGTALDVQDRMVVGAFVDRVAAGLRQQQSQQEAAELRAVAEADALRAGLLRAVSHDLRTPLSTIEANVSSLLQPDVRWTADEQQDFLISIEREVHRLTRLVTNLLDAGRLEVGVVAPRSVDVDLEDVVASALETIDTLGRRLEIDLPEDLPPVRTDPDLLERVIANVVANACRFTAQDDAVRIAAGPTPSGVSLLVVDRGPGIPVRDRSKLLAPFQRLNDEGSGAGLGLTVASGFVDLLDGELRFEDTPGGGLTVIIELPGART